MPGLNRKGPMGQGPMTGRGLGNCAGKKAVQPEDTSNDQSTDTRPGRGMGRGFGKGRGVGQGNGKGMGNRFRGGR